MKLRIINEFKQNDRERIKSFLCYTLKNKHYTDSLHGGLGDGVDLQKAFDIFGIEALIDGIIVELEHTDSIAVALEITIDHLTEDKEYYIKLKTIESH